MIDYNLASKLRKLQAEEIKKTQESVSFSKVLNDSLRKSLK